MKWDKYLLPVVDSSKIYSRPKKPSLVKKGFRKISAWVKAHVDI